MKIIITENQFYNMIPNYIKRRVGDGDLELIDKIIKKHIHIKSNLLYSENFEGYLNTVISDSISDFIFFHKDWGIDNGDDWSDKRRELMEIFQGLIPILKKKYYNECKEYYKKMKS